MVDEDGPGGASAYLLQEILENQNGFTHEAQQLRTMADTVQERVKNLDPVNQTATYATLILKEAEQYADTEWLNHLKKLLNIATSKDGVAATPEGKEPSP